MTMTKTNFAIGGRVAIATDQGEFRGTVTEILKTRNAIKVAYDTEDGSPGVVETISLDEYADCVTKLRGRRPLASYELAGAVPPPATRAAPRSEANFEPDLGAEIAEIKKLVAGLYKLLNFAAETAPAPAPRAAPRAPVAKHTPAANFADYKDEAAPVMMAPRRARPAAVPVARRPMQ